MSNVYIFGTSGGCLDSFYLYKELFGESKNLYFLSDSHKVGEKIHGHEVAGSFEIVKKISTDDSYFVYQCGSSENHKTRNNWFDISLNSGLKPKTLISKDSYVHQTAKIGHGSIIYPGVKIMANVKIGTNCIILPNTVINHDTKVGDFCIINSLCVINGSVNIGCNSYVGSSTSIKEKIQITSNVTIGMGSNILKSLDIEGIYFGSPAMLIR